MSTHVRVSRRSFTKGSLATLGGLALGGAGGAAAASYADPSVSGDASCPGGEDLALVNGTFVTLAGDGKPVKAIAIRNGRIAEVGRPSSIGPCSRTINLQGRTVIPGLIDSHQHFLRANLNPGHETRAIEPATTIAELQEAIAERARSVPAGEFLTCIGGWNRNGLEEKRLPTRAELDDAAPLHGVYLSETGGGNRAVTNSIGRAFFLARGVAVDDQGVLLPAAGRAALVAVQTSDDKRRGNAEAMAYVASLGLTTVHDQGGVPLADYEYAHALARAGEIPVRLRLFLTGFDFPTLDGIKAIVNNNLKQQGSELFRTVGIGERIATNPTPAMVTEAMDFLGERGWSLSLHTLSATETAVHIAALKEAARKYPVDELRWQLLHLNDASVAQLQDLADLDVPIGLQGWRYTGTGGAPFRTALDLGIPTGGGTDASNVAAQNPWLMLYYMVTGRNNAGTVQNAGQQISREEALRMYTAGSAYLAFDEDDYGTIETGKVADLAVLSEDYMTVPEERIKKLRSVLTLQGGRPVSASGPFAELLG